jgi:hypothetical protein
MTILYFTQWTSPSKISGHELADIEGGRRKGFFIKMETDLSSQRSLDTTPFRKGNGTITLFG